ncbi:succinate dehydrogenase, hydrophobic membrane anchor protein [Acidihalobacter aeolianus]|uniref:Succinate dehydrogenase hydrophobic membrane anchor subunit n=1 Tax=Acidihalobacter aeolianus TaxID=2792603 RepID=A0A1D8K7L0_9GAMM|nr:succinate dehydrogenase, hydrophobic membrane anchor protein [Acidihalobacter aeolianus]AOV16932.1 succinate dehydrogenase, hydrophobic membrane anchor protein [Acidihalobacter aeolianus]
MKSGLSGLRAWLLQRLTAIYLGGFFVLGILALGTHPYLDYAQWHRWLAQPLVLLLLALFMVALLLHAWVGVRDVLVDYVRPLGLRVGLMALAATYLLGCGLWAVRILLQTKGL